MSVARPVFKRVRLMLTRRVRGRLLLLRPSKRTNQIVRYVVAVMQKRWNIEVHALIAMGNHWHVVLHDPDGSVVEFQRDCHHFIASAVNAHHGEFENLWSVEQTSRVECEEPVDVISKIAYAMANPVEARLVRHGSSWPGVRHAWPRKPIVVEKPPRFFRGQAEGGRWPDVAVLEFTRPQGYDELSDDEHADLIRSAIEEREESFRRKYDAEGRAFLGRRNVLRQSRHTAPRSRETRFGISPKVACRDKWRRIERLRANKRWLEGYRNAFARWARGDRNVVFPAGTYKMRAVHGVHCANAPP